MGVKVDIEIASPKVTKNSRISGMMDSVERIYLRILRAAVLVIATGLIIYAACLGVWSFYKIFQSPNSVVEQPAVVVADDITDAAMSAAPVDKKSGEPKIDPAHQKFYGDFVTRYYALFQHKFEPFRQQEDKRLTRDQFDDAFIDSQARMAAVAKGDLSFETDKQDLEQLLAVMTDASAKPVTQKRLQEYRKAKKVQVARKVQQTRTEYRSGWNRYSTACDDWFYTPYGCAERRAVEVPYTQTVYSMAYPEGTQSHTDIFRAFQDRFYQLLNARRQENRSVAENKRGTIAEGNVQGKLTLLTVLQILGGFLVLMFFFLLIAIERHQRSLVMGQSVTDVID